MRCSGSLQASPPIRDPNSAERQLRAGCGGALLTCPVMRPGRKPITLYKDVLQQAFSGPPLTIVLTHGHFDHVCVAAERADHWDANVAAPPLKFRLVAAPARRWRWGLYLRRPLADGQRAL
jgi:glyoxylase-like metal-dependent hydrolase (beta-lactamase superfamily II)